MSWSTFLGAMRQIKRIRTIDLIGLNFAGEPLLHLNFLEMVDYINSSKELGIVLRSKFPFIHFRRGYSIAFTTNGSLLSPHRFDSLNGKVDRIQISIDGLKEDTERQRQGQSYATVEANAKYAIANRRGRTKIAIHATRTTQSEESLEKFKQKWQDADEVSISEAHNGDLYRSTGTVKPDCHELNHYLAVLWNGNITTCCADLAGKNVCGNLFDDGILGGTKRGPLCKKCNIMR